MDSMQSSILAFAFLNDYIYYQLPDIYKKIIYLLKFAENNIPYIA